MSMNEKVSDQGQSDNDGGEQDPNPGQMVKPGEESPERKGISSERNSKVWEKEGDAPIPTQEEADAEQKRIEREEEEQRIHELEAEDIRKNCRPSWIANIYVRFPVPVCCCFSIFFILMILTAFLANFMTLSENGDRDYLVWTDERVEQYDMLQLIKKESEKSVGNTSKPLRMTKVGAWQSQYLYDCQSSCSNILTIDKIKKIKDLETKARSDSRFSQFCLAASTTNTSCAAGSYTSLIKELDAAGFAYDTQANLDTQINTLISTKYNTIKYLFAPEFNASNPKSARLRSFFSFAGPINYEGKRYRDMSDDEKKQDDAVQKFSMDILDDTKKADIGLWSFFVNGLIFNFLFNQIVMRDLYLSAASFLFVWGYITFHLRSFFLSTCAMINIFMSFPLTLIIYRGIFQISYFQTLHILSIFIILGIAADDVFVFMDAWSQAGRSEIIGGDLKKRMAYTMRRASKAIFVTSSTTAFAFLATGFSTIMPISAFGYFAFVLVPMNYLLVISIFPTQVVIYEKTFGKYCPTYEKICCFSCNMIKKLIDDQKKESKIETSIDAELKKEDQNKNQSMKPINDEDVSNNQLEEEGGENESIGDINQVINPSISEQENVSNSDQIPELKDKPQFIAKKDPLVERCFKGPCTWLLSKGSILWLILTLAWIGIAIWQATRLGPQTKREQWLPSSNDVQKALEVLADKFHKGENDQAIRVRFVWGVDGVSKPDQLKNRWNSKYLGELVWNNEFNPGPLANRERMRGICNTMDADALVLNAQYTFCPFQKFYNSVGAAAWNGYSEAAFYTAFKNWADTDSTGVEYTNKQLIGFHANGTIRWIEAEFMAKGEPFSKWQTLNPIYLDWKDKEKTFNAAGTKATKLLMSGGDYFANMPSQRAFLRNAVQGMMMSIAFSFLVLLIATRNIFTAIYAIIAIIGIVVSVTAVMAMAGWQFGTAESIAIVVIIGFSVDYVVHLGNHYVDAPFPTKYRRMKHSLAEIGISIISGAATTIGSGLILFFATMIFFQKFAILILSTILFSLFFSLVYFTSINFLIGPQRTCGDMQYWIISPLWRLTKKLLSKCPCCKKKEKEGDMTETETPNKEVAARPSQLPQEDKGDLNVEEVGDGLSPEKIPTHNK